MKPSSEPAEVDARGVAYAVLQRVDADGAFASRALDAAIARAGLDARDARLAAAIVYGTLRNSAALDHEVAARCERPPRGDRLVACVLRAGAYQLAALDRSAVHAVVDHAVTYVKARRGPRVAGFVNAVLRRFAAAPPALDASPDAALASLGLDDEVVARLRASVSESTLRALVSPEAPPIDLRVVRGERIAIQGALRKAQPDAGIEPTPFARAGLRTRRVGDPRRLPGFDDGSFVVQDEGSQLVASALAVRPGERVLDACAGRGGKTLVLAQALSGSGSVLAVDVHEPKLEALVRDAERLGFRAVVETLALDLSVGVGPLRAEFDAVLVDAPCSGLGTLRRRPELARRVSATRLDELTTLQRGILARAASLVRSGGRLVYAVCSPLDEESRGVISDALPPGFRPLPFASSELGGLDVESDGSLRLGPRVDDPRWAMDAYRVFRFERVDSAGAGS